MKFHVLTLFPEMIINALNESILGRAVENGIISVDAVNMRDFTTAKHGKVDDYTYGGGAGMLIQAQPVYDAYMNVTNGKKVRTVYVTPQGFPFNQKMAQDFSKEEELVFICGHYEGIDERALEEVVTDYVSIGDYVLTGGELPAMVMIDAISRLIPGVLNNETSATVESFHKDLLEYPQYSRPEIWHEKKVPQVLLSGNHKEIEKWRLEQSIERTRKRRPDLYEKYKNTEKAVQELSKKKRNNIHIIEALKRGTGDLLYRADDNYVVYNRQYDLCFIKITNENYLQDIMDKIPANCGSFKVSQASMVGLIEDKKNLTKKGEFLNLCYTNNNPLSVKFKDIRPINIEYIDYIRDKYEFCEDEYLVEQLQNSEIFGAFVDDKICGFVGAFVDGSIGMLYVEEECRRRGIGSSLASYMINRHRQLDFLPFWQVPCDKTEVVRLLSRLGLYESDEKIVLLKSKELKGIRNINE